MQYFLCTTKKLYLFHSANGCRSNKGIIVTIISYVAWRFYLLAWAHNMFPAWILNMIESVTPMSELVYQFYFYQNLLAK